MFEMQLMPALLLQLQVNDLASQETPEQYDANSSLSKRAENNSPGRTAQAEGVVAPTPSAGGGTGTTGVVAQERRGGTATAGEENLEDEEGDREEGENAAMPAPSAEDRERLRTLGMDWGVVGVWSCPRSCDASCEECVVVQLPV